MKEIRLSASIVVRLNRIKEHGRVTMNRLIIAMLVNVCGEVADAIIALLDRNHNMTSMDLLETPIIRDIVHRMKRVICNSVVNPCEELAELL